ncbi:MAG: TlpA family protein disulfide reductase [Rhodobacteraceae bacterium]|nr:TlpA family protein disulfide reductase [Paracoccaceae bacterium]
MAADLAALRTGDMARLVLADPPVPLPEVALLDETGATRSLAEYRGRYVVLNLWATWCAPCRTEMPQLQALQSELGGDRLAVATVAVGRNAVPAIERFFAEAGVTDLPRLRDPGQDLAAALGVFGLPVTLILDPAGREIARLTGEADWSSPEARALLAALIAG